MNIYDNNKNVIAVLIKSTYSKSGISFFTLNAYSQQLAYMHHDSDHVIMPHVHNDVKREILQTKEVLIIRKGKLRCDFYTDDREYIKSIIITDGDVLLLVSGGHGFVCLDETEMVEVKQGPYVGEADKTRFEPVEESRINIVDTEEVEE